MQRRLMHPKLLIILAMMAVAFSWMIAESNPLVAGEADESSTSDASVDVSQVARLVEDLGSPKFQIREVATSRLVEIGDSAEAALLEATNDADPERARRARFALVEIRKPKLAELNERDLKRLKGKWTYESVFLSGKPEVSGGHLVIGDTELMIEKAGGRDPYGGMTFTLNAAEFPKHLDFTHKKFTIRCLYRLEEDKLTLCYSSQSGGTRPKRIQCKDSDGLRFHVLTRASGSKGSSKLSKSDGSSEGGGNPPVRPDKKESNESQEQEAEPAPSESIPMQPGD